MTDSKVGSVAQWVAALDRELAERYDGRASDQISFGYANGNAAGVSLSYDHPAVDDERGILVSVDGAWVVRFDIRNKWWIPT